MLTTITPYWGRPDTLAAWLEAVKHASIPGMKHIVFFIGEPIPDWVQLRYGMDTEFLFVPKLEDKPGDLSIGHYHNLGAKLACTEWMMKLDVDTIPNMGYFRELRNVLRTARATEWFNGGMMYISSTASAQFLSAAAMPLREETYKMIMADRRRYCESRFIGPAATNFICRTGTYLALGGCDSRFRGYGWEDYQQIYALELYQRGKDPLPGVITFENVHRRCCQEISRLKARALLVRNPMLCLFHRYHASSSTPNYKTHEVMHKNRQILLEHVLQSRKERMNYAGQ